MKKINNFNISDIEIIDTHCHLNLEPLYPLSQELIKKIKNNSLINIPGTDISSCKIAISLAKEYNNFICSVGIHPLETNEKNIDYDLNELDDLLKKNIDFINSVGEIGLDYYHEHNKDVQKKYLIKQIELAIKYNLPIVFHVRDAHDDFIEIIKPYLKSIKKCLVHCFDGDINILKKYDGLDFFFAIGGKITYSNSTYLIETIKNINLNRLMIETDAPYLTPVPFRKLTNSPLYIPIIIEKISSILENNDMKNIFLKNMCDFFEIK